MTFDEDVIIGRSIKKSDKIIEKLQGKELVFGYVLVCLNEKRTGLELYPSFVFFQKRMKDLDILVVGIFKNNKDAFEFLRVLSEKAVSKFGDCDLIKALKLYGEDDK